MVVVQVSWSAKRGVNMSVHQDSRMYEAKYPEVDDVVMVQVSDVVTATYVLSCSRCS